MSNRYRKPPMRRGGCPNEKARQAGGTDVTAVRRACVSISKLLPDGVCRMAGQVHPPVIGRHRLETFDAEVCLCRHRSIAASVRAFPPSMVGNADIAVARLQIGSVAKLAMRALWTQDTSTDYGQKPPNVRSGFGQQCPHVWRRRYGYQALLG